MGWYERVVFNRILERALDQPAVAALRRATLQPARGAVLEVGIGTGLNLDCYPSGLRRITAVSRDATLDERAVVRARAAKVAVSHVQGDAAQLPFQPAQFDTVICTFLLCSVPDQAAVVAELARVLKPDGQVLYLEHVRAGSGATRVFQGALSPLLRGVNCGCSPARDTAAALAAGPLGIAELAEEHLPEMPWMYRRLIHGRLAGAALRTHDGRS